MTDPHGREGIGVAQGHAGHDYPLVRPSDDVRYLLADFYLSFDQPGDYGLGADLEPPFRIHWLSGFGTDPPGFTIPTVNSASASGDPAWNSICSTGVTGSEMGDVVSEDCLPTPVHPHDIMVVDRNGRVVFDSSDPFTTHDARDWGTRLKVVTWRHATNAVCNLVYHTEWNEADFPIDQTYPSYFFPENAILGNRTIERLPKRIRSLEVVLDNIAESAVSFSAGYNMQLAVTAPVTTDGQRRVNRVTFDASPGGGLGVFPDCQPEQLFIRQINGVGPDDAGYFHMTADGCMWVRQPTRVVSADPRVTMPETNLSPGNIPTPGLPDPAAGTTTSAAGWPENSQYAHLWMGNDCTACCDCDDYVAVAQYMNQTRNDYKDMGTSAETARDQYHVNRERWLSATDCIKSKPLRLRMLPQLCPFLDVAVQYCNQTEKCVTEVELSVTFEVSPESIGEIMPGFSQATGVFLAPGRMSGTTERYTMGGEWPTFTAFFDIVNPGQSVSARFRIQFPGCTETLAVTGTLTGTAGGSTILLPNNTVASVEDTRTLNCPLDPDDVTDLLVCDCS